MRIVLEVLLDDEQVTPHVVNVIRSKLQSRAAGVLSAHPMSYGARDLNLDYEISVRVEVDEQPGSSWSNPIWYRGYRIYVGDNTPFQYVHDDYDGAPDSYDTRFGRGNSVDECKEEIDDAED